MQVKKDRKKERSGFSGVKVDAAIALNLIQLSLREKELIGPQGHRIQSLNNSNGSAPQTFGKIATQPCFSDESYLTTECER